MAAETAQLSTPMIDTTAVANARPLAEAIQHRILEREPWIHAAQRRLAITNDDCLFDDASQKT